jgi:hypothetical protein
VGQFCDEDAQHVHDSLETNDDLEIEDSWHNPQSIKGTSWCSFLLAKLR